MTYDANEYKTLRQLSYARTPSELLAFCRKHRINNGEIAIKAYLAHLIVGWLEASDFGFEVAKSMLETPSSWRERA